MSKIRKGFRVMIVGCVGTGRTTMTTNFCIDSPSLYEYALTLEDYTFKRITTDDTEYDMDIDDGGEEAFSISTEMASRNCDGIVLLYDITDHSSFDQLAEFHEKMIRIRSCYIDDVDEDKIRLPAVVCGNKCDLSDQRKVSTEEGQRFADSLGYPFFEISAEKSLNLKQAFHTLIDAYGVNNSNQEGNEGRKKRKERKRNDRCTIC